MIVISLWKIANLDSEAKNPLELVSEDFLLDSYIQFQYLKLRIIFVFLKPKNSDGK